MMTPATQQNSTYWPTDNWRTSTPEEQGMDSETLIGLVNDLSQGANISAHSLLIIRHGHIVLDVSSHPFRTDQLHELFSATKSFMSTLAGIVIDQGLIKSVDQSIWDFFAKEGVANMDARKEAIQLKHLLTMTSGLDYVGAAGAIDPLYIVSEQDHSWVSWMLDQPMTWEPGANWRYSDGQSHLVSAIIQKATGQTALDFARENVFRPLGISDLIWLADPQGITRAGQDLFLSPRDMAKLGYLFLHNGEWDGRQLVSKAWVDAASSPYWKRPRYGYFWWLQQEPESYAAMGFGGQLIYVFPQQDMVMVLTGAYENSGDALRNSVVRAAQSDQPLPPNPDAQQRLQLAINALQFPKPVAVLPLPTLANQISGKLYTLPLNNEMWTAIGLTFKDEQALLTLDVHGTRLQIPVGLDGIYHITQAGLPALAGWLRPLSDVPLAARGSWKTDTHFAISMRDLMGMQELELSLDFKDGLKVELLENYAVSNSLPYSFTWTATPQ